MTGTQSLLRPLGALAVAGLLAGCAGAGPTPPASSSAPLGVSQVQSLALPIEAAKCKGSVFSFNDKTCAAGGIATVTGSRGTYAVTWGTKSGSCGAVFTDKVGGKTVGTAKLSVRNTA
jgi:hypothetical protein